jgi:hypothetical protein
MSNNWKNILSIIAFGCSAIWTYKTWFEFESFLALVGSIGALIAFNVNGESSNSLHVKGNNNRIIQKSNAKSLSNKAIIEGNDNSPEQQ